MLYFKCFAMDKIVEFCHIESGGENVTSLMKLRSYSIHISLLVFKNYSRSYKMAPW